MKHLTRCRPRFIAMMLLGLISLAATLHAQTTPPSVTGQLVDSRRGYVMRVPGDSKLDSLRSGWDPRTMSETRSYVTPETGMIRITAMVRPMQIPADTISTGAYTYTQADSATERGTAKIRTYYLPTRSVRIEIIPFGLKGHRYIEASDKIFMSLRWKPGATSDQVEIE